MLLWYDSFKISDEGDVNNDDNLTLTMITWAYVGFLLICLLARLPHTFDCYLLKKYDNENNRKKKKGNNFFHVKTRDDGLKLKI